MSTNRPGLERVAIAGVVATITSIVACHGLIAVFGGRGALSGGVVSLVAALLAVVCVHTWSFRGRLASDASTMAISCAAVGAMFAVAARSIFGTAAGGRLAAPLALALVGLACGYGVPRLAHALPDALDGAFARRRARGVLWVIAALLAVVQTGRIGAFMSDPGLPQASLMPPEAFIVHHSCMSAYVNAIELLRRGISNVYDAALYPPDPHNLANAPTPAADLGPFNLDYYEYPPPFLLLPKLGMLFTGQFLTLRAVWFAIEAGSFALVLLLMARWLGGRQALFAGLLAPVVWISIPTLLNFQIGNFHIVAIAMSIGAMLAFDRRRFALGGAMLAFAIVSKLSPGLLLVYLAAGRRWREIGWTLGFALVYVGLSLVVFGPGPFAAFMSYQLPRIANGDAFAFFEGDTTDIAMNDSIYGLAYKLKTLGLVAAPRGLAIALSWIYTVPLLIAAYLAGRRPADRAGQAAVWLALINLGALRSPFAPLYVVVSTLWLLTILAPEIHGRGRWTAALAAAWVLTSLVPPIPAVAALIAVSLTGQAIYIGVNAWVLLRRPPALSNATAVNPQAVSAAA
jgi:hypothetical protein